MGGTVGSPAAIGRRDHAQWWVVPMETTVRRQKSCRWRQPCGGKVATAARGQLDEEPEDVDPDEPDPDEPDEPEPEPDEPDPDDEPDPEPDEPEPEPDDPESDEPEDVDPLPLDELSPEPPDDDPDESLPDPELVPPAAGTAAVEDLDAPPEPRLSVL